jgi:hypothetical protein
MAATQSGSDDFRSTLKRASVSLIELSVPKGASKK